MTHIVVYTRILTLLVGGGADAELLSGGAWGQGKFFLLLLMKKNFFSKFFFLYFRLVPVPPSTQRRLFQCLQREQA